MKSTRIGVVAGVVAALAVALAAIAAPAAAAGQQGNGKKKYKATRAIVVDKDTGEARLPTDAEIEQTVASLESSTSRPENPEQSIDASGAVSADLGGGFAGVLLARPAGDGTWETKCVFTFDEGAEFLGLIADDVQ